MYKYPIHPPDEKKLAAFSGRVMMDHGLLSDSESALITFPATKVLRVVHWLDVRNKFLYAEIYLNPIRGILPLSIWLTAAIIGDQLMCCSQKVA